VSRKRRRNDLAGKVGRAGGIGNLELGFKAGFPKGFPIH
jgi:hypothetical protein